MLKKRTTQEQIFNRILINIGIAIVAYITLYVIYTKFYLVPAIPIGIVFLILSAVGYILSAKKIVRAVNYAHMFLAFALCLFFTRLSVFVGTAVGMTRFIEIIKSSEVMAKLMNSRYEVILISWLGAIYLLIMLIYNSVLIYKIGRKK